MILDNQAKHLFKSEVQIIEFKQKMMILMRDD